MAVVTLCPSRGRPQSARELLKSFEATKRDPKSRLVLVLDSDDPTKDDYPGEVYVTKPGGSFVPALNAAAHDLSLMGDAKAIGFVGDDCRFRTQGWDVKLGKWLTENVGIAWGDDGWDHPWAKEDKASHWWLSRPIVDAFGMAPAGLRHFYVDDFWAQIGWAAGCAKYFADVLIEHRHPMAGKATDDATYQRPTRFIASDKAWWSRWQRRGKQKDVARLRGLITKSGPRRVFADWHHPALWESLEILFSDRYGWELYSPIGMEWATKGFWGFTHEKWTAEDYLKNSAAVLRGDHWEAPQPEYPERQRKMLTLEQADRLRPDIVLASVVANDAPFAALAKRWGARYVYQMGNARQPVSRMASVNLASVSVHSRPKVIRYHQEFDTGLFGPSPIKAGTSVSAFMLRLDSASCDYRWLSKAEGVDWHDWGGVDLRARTYLAPMSRVAEEMRKSGWVWHDKKIGDGYGHVIHNAASIGRPLIGHSSHYKGKLAEPYWRDLETCIDLDRHSQDTALRLLRAISRDPEWHESMAERMREEFAKRVDFAAEASEIRAALA